MEKEGETGDLWGRRERVIISISHEAMSLPCRPNPRFQSCRPRTPQKDHLNPTMDTRIRDETSRLRSHLIAFGYLQVSMTALQNRCTTAALEDSIVEEESLGLLVDFRLTAPKALIVGHPLCFARLSRLLFIRGIDRKVYDVA